MTTDLILLLSVTVGPLIAIWLVTRPIGHRGTTRKTRRKSSTPGQGH